mgnify:CR=1 FL=1
MTGDLFYFKSLYELDKGVLLMDYRYMRGINAIFSQSADVHLVLSHLKQVGIELII